MSGTQFHYLWRSGGSRNRFRTAASLHSHTMASRESMAFLPHYAYAVPLLRDVVHAHERRYERKRGGHVDYSRAFWTPPLAPREAFDLETRQIEERLDLCPLVSLTDHDTIDACTHLQALDSTS